MTWKRWSLVTLLVVTLLGGGLRVHAALVVPCDTTIENGQFTDPCTVDKFVEQFIILSQYALSIVVVLGMLMMVYGGVQFITAAGRPAKVEEGKRVIEGTIIGIIISMTAFVIVNFTIAAVTGSAVASHSINPFGAIARVFSGKKGLERAFNTTGQTSGGGGCQSLTTGWDKDCSNQLHCADASKDSGAIHDLQKKLSAAGCTDDSNAGLVADGCFGPKTYSAVRRFQIANQLPPTGQVDDQTLNRLNGGGQTCTSNTTLISGVVAQLPTVQDASQTFSATQTGCCVVKNSSGQPLFCGDKVSERTCAGVGSFAEFYGGDPGFFSGVSSCATDTSTRNVCGYCQDSRDQQCFQTTSAHWCTDIVRDSASPNFRMTFQAGRTCNGESACQNGCTSELLNLPP